MESIPHVLACDVGNSAIHFAAVHEDTVTDVRTIPIGQLKDLGEAIGDLWNEMPSQKYVAAGSVNPEGLKALKAAVARVLHEPLLVVGRELPLPIETRLAHPEAIGVDRLCCAAAAFDHLGTACVVADFGTAITIDCVDETGMFMGGAILPGLQMGARSLEACTAQLPKVTLRQPDWVFGQDTQQAITGGLIYGARGALRERVEAYASELGAWPAVIITGGDAKLICADPQKSELVQARVDDLTVRGVAMAYYKSLLK